MELSCDLYYTISVCFMNIIVEVSAFCGNIHIPWILSAFRGNIHVLWILSTFRPLYLSSFTRLMKVTGASYVISPWFRSRVTMWHVTDIGPFSIYQVAVDIACDCGFSC